MIYWKYFKNQIITSNTIMCLDIEVSSFWVDDVTGEVLEYDKTKSDSYYNDNCRKGSLVYIWMFGIEDKIYYGREWNDFPKFLNKIKKCAQLTDKEHLYIYVHNLAYEFQFLRNFNWEWDNVFCREVRKPMKASYNIFEFRCSFMLTHLSLENWGKQLNVKKLVGFLDYEKLITPLDALTDRQLAYCEHDIMVMYAGLTKYRDKYKSISKIPLTQTGEVRKVFKDMYRHKKGYHNFMTKLLPRTVEEYKIFRAVFGGGDTHANIEHVGKVCLCASYDETSCYPYELVSKMFPMSSFIKVKNDTPIKPNKFAYLIGLKMTDVKLIGAISYLAKSRCQIVSGGIYDNGRIVSADTCILYCTEVDYVYIKKLYAFNEEIFSLRRAIKQYLDTDYVKYVLELFSDKTTLKGVEGMNDFYLEKKQRLNSLYGCMVYDEIGNPEILFNGDWQPPTHITSDCIESRITDLHKKKYKNNLSFIHGVYCTAYARADLWEMICAISDNTDKSRGRYSDVVYYDTDSCKFMNYDRHKQLFEESNKKRIKLLEKACNYHKLPYDLFKPIAPNGEQSILGTWDYEGKHKFKTLGAKKYVIKKGDKYKITVSGVPKRASDCITCFDDFHDGFIFDREVCKKGLSTYLDGDNYQGIVKGYRLKQPYGLNIRHIGYTLGLTEEFLNMIQIIKNRGKL